MNRGWNRRSCSHAHAARFLAVVLVAGTFLPVPAAARSTRLEARGDVAMREKAAIAQRARAQSGAAGTISYGKLYGAPCGVTNGPGDGSVTVTLDPLGSFGSTQWGNAVYDPVGADAPAGTTFDTAVFFSPIGDYLTTVGLNGDPTNTTVTVIACTPTQFVTSWSIAGYDFLLTQSLGPASSAGSLLTQTYEITNTQASTRTFSTTRYFDGDLAFDGSIADGGKVVTDDNGNTTLSEFDAVGSNSVKSVVSIFNGPTDGTQTAYSMQPWNGYQFADEIRTNSGIPPALRNQVAGDANGDGVTDTNYDVTLGLQHAFSVGAGQTVTYTAVTEWADKPVFTADIDVTVTDNWDPVASNEDLLTYNITVHNSGPETAYGIVVTGTLDALTTYQDDGGPATCTPPNPNTGGGNAICNIADLIPGQSRSFTITVNVLAPPGSTVTFTASAVSGLSFDPDTGNNQDSETTGVVAPAPDASITKTGTPEPVAQDGYLVYTLTVYNNGPGIARGAMVADSIPAGTGFSTVSASQGSVTPIPWGTTGTVRAALGDIRRGATAIVTITVFVTAAAGSTFSNVATVTLNPNNDPNPANNTSASFVSHVNVGAGRADLSIAKTDSPDPVAVGGRLTYAIEVGNAGPNAANNVMVFDATPPGTRLYSIGSSQGTYETPTGGVGRIVFSLGTVPAGGRATASFVVDVNSPSGDSIASSATVLSATSNDPAPGNNSVTTYTQLLGGGGSATADVAVQQTMAAGGFESGRVGSITFTVTNLGPGIASYVRLSGATPGGTTFAALRTSQGTAETPTPGETGEVVATIGTLGVGATASVTLDVNVTSPPGSTISSSASVSTGASDPNSANNTATAAAPVTRAGGPSVERVVGLDGPFRLRIQGSGFDPGSRVFIGEADAPWENTVVRNARVIIVRKGQALAALFPRGVEVPIRIVNPDGSFHEVKFRRSAN